MKDVDIIKIIRDGPEYQGSYLVVNCSVIICLLCYVYYTLEVLLLIIIKINVIQLSIIC